MDAIFLFYFISILRISSAVDTIAVNQLIRDGETITSAGGSFELGFFSPGSSKNRYVAIWYKKVASGTVVWVANREIPLTDSSGVLKVTDKGILVILDGINGIIWSSNSSPSQPAQNPNVQLLESGNLVMKNGIDSNPENFLWQSFDHPGNTLLPGMRLGRDKVTGQERYLSSWKSPDDPSKGNFTYWLDADGHPQLLVRNGLAVKFSSGPWNGVQFSGLPLLVNPNPVYTYTLVFNEKETYGFYELVNSKIILRIVLSDKGYPQRFTWIDHEWKIYSNTKLDDCANYAICGVYGICKINRSPKCECLRGFFPKFQSYWDKGDWSSGCVRNTSLDCHKRDGFVKYSSVKLPDSQKSWSNASMNLEECASMCLRNCSCTAYASSDIRGGGSGCLLWFGDLIDIRQIHETGQEVYVRMAASELDAFARINSSKKRLVIISCVSTIGIILISLVLKLYISKKKHPKRKGQNFVYNLEGSDSEEDLDLRLFKFATISRATNNFSSSNKLGQGSFGPVYKGTLQSGKDIAVKRLSKSSIQGSDEFKNEAIYMSKLQHRNLVKLLGCCIHEEEKMLIYEYMPNRSLNHFIFDQEKSIVLDWPKRFRIINGIARGLLYLHQDSRLRIIHRDIKTDNILLDSEMNPKISDFGMAKCFGGNEIEVNTNTVVGTYGYMSPEYAIAGLYSTKSDVFSFGVLVLEVVSGKRNRGFYSPKYYINLLGYAWTLYMEGRCLELIDASIGDTCNLSEVLRSIHVGLLCVQRCPGDRPSMSSAILMLSSEGALPQPEEPGFFSETCILGANSKPDAASFSGDEDENNKGNSDHYAD